jgi:hypothetical protein
VLGFVGCQSQQTEEWPLVEELPISVKENAKLLRAEIVEASYDFIYAKDFFAYQDSIMIVLNKAYRDVHFVEFYNLNSNKAINSFISVGNGPGEMLNTLAHVRRNELFVHDFAKNQIGIINIDSVLHNPDYRIKPPVQFSNNVGSPFVTFYRNTQLIMQNPYYFLDKKLKIDNKAPRLIVTEIGDDNGKLSSLDGARYYTYNVSQGLIIPNLDKNRLIYASSFLNELGMYDMDLNPIKFVMTPDDIKPIYRFDDGNQIIFNGVAPYAYRGHYIDNNYFYVSYVGDYFSGDKHLKDFSSWIFKFDWSGNFIESFHSPEYINTLSKSPNKNIFYGRGFDEDGTTVLWKLSLID